MFLLNKVSQCSPECTEIGMPQQSTMRKQVVFFYPQGGNMCSLLLSDLYITELPFMT